MSRFDEGMLHALTAMLDEDVADIMKEFQSAGMEPDTRQVLVRLFDDQHAGEDLGPLIVARGTLAANIWSNEDLEVRKAEVTQAINAWIDGFVIATRYAAEQAKPKTPKSMRII